MQPWLKSSPENVSVGPIFKGFLGSHLLILSVNSRSEQAHRSFDGGKKVPKQLGGTILEYVSINPLDMLIIVLDRYLGFLNLLPFNAFQACGTVDKHKAVNPPPWRCKLVATSIPACLFSRGECVMVSRNVCQQATAGAIGRLMLSRNPPK